MDTILQKIQKLKDRFVKFRGDSRDVVQIDGWMGEAKRLFLLKSLKDHDGIKYVLEIFEGEIAKINETLKKSYSKDLKDTERDILLNRRDLAQKYVNLFSGVDEQLDKLEELVDSETV